jgi:hypothetical protein
MSIEQAVLEKLRALPPDKQREVLAFVESLDQQRPARAPRRSLLGLCEDLGVHISEVDLAEARREMWGSFPREDL